MLTNPQELIDGLMPNLTTNLTQTECYRLSLMAPKAVTYDIIQNSIPLEGTYKDATIRKMAVLEVDFEANKKFPFAGESVRRRRHYFHIGGFCGMIL